MREQGTGVADFGKVAADKGKAPDSSGAFD
jgi:hypothetical protein